jgi:hypothetical protein
MCVSILEDRGISRPEMNDEHEEDSAVFERGSIPPPPGKDA